MTIFIGFDLETTGVKPHKDRPVQACLAYTTDQDKSKYVILNTYVNPLMQIDKGASDVHGITADKVMTAPLYTVIAWQINLIVKTMKEMDKTYLVTMNGQAFDVPMIDQCNGGNPVFEGIDHIDVFTIANRYFPDLKSRKLGDLYKVFIGKELEGAHDATVDVMATLDVMEAMRKKLTMSYEDLSQQLKKPTPFSVMPFGKHKGKLIDEVPRSWAVWMNKQEGSMSPDLRATIDYILEK